MVKCIQCGKKFEKFQMKNSTTCNICSYFKNSKKDLERTYKKFRNAKVISA